MKILYTKFLFLIVALVGFSNANFVQAQMLKVIGQKTVNSSNDQEVVLHTMNFGNWMVMEGYMMNSANQAGSQYIWKQKLTTLLGADKTKQFYDAWLTNYVTQADINKLKEWGFNSVRLPLHYEYFVNLGMPDVWNDQGFQILDNVISWCKTAGIYVIIDLHAAPGGQSDGAISDYDKTKPGFWGNEAANIANKAKTVRLWRKLSERYVKEEWVAGYDLINEPAWTLPGGTELHAIYKRLTDTIRANNDNHILFIEGNWYSNDYTGLTPAWDANMVYVFHKYWSTNKDADIKWVLDLRAAQNRPIWCGEHGENGNENFTKTVELFKRNNIGLSWWPMKKFGSLNDFADCKWPVGYDDVLKYFGGTNPSLSPTTAFNTLMQLAENLKLENTKKQTEVLRGIFTQVDNRKTEAFSENKIPGRIFAPNYDMGMNGYAYYDQAAEDLHVSTGTYTPWNEGWAYRNNGVDVETCLDDQSNGYNVGWFNRGEWMKYTSTVANAGTYTIEFRIANGGGSTGTVQIQNEDGTKILATATVPTTGGWKTWQTVTCTGGFSETGTQTFRIVNSDGGYNLASVNFVFANANIPATTPVPKMVSVVSFKGNNSKYLAYDASTGLISSSSANEGASQKFTLVEAGAGLFAIRGDNGLYVTLNTSDNKLYCNGTSIGDNQKFGLENLSNIYAIQGFNKMYVSSENGSSNGITCTRTAPGGWEYFNMNTISMNPVVDVTGVSLTPTSAVVKIGTTKQLTPTIAPANASNTAVSYTSSNTAIATVNASGLISAIAEGVATITVSTMDGSKTANCNLTVNNIATGLNDVEEKAGYRLFPNPAQNTISIASLSNRLASISVCDLSGKTLISNSFIGYKNTIDISGIANGFYFVKILDNNKIETIKFLKSN